MENRDTQAKGAKGTGVLIPLLILLIALLVVLFKLPSQKDTGVVKKQEVYLAFDDFHNMIGGNDQLAVSEKKELFSGYVGKYVNWVGELTRIEGQPSGDFILRIRQLPSTQDYDVSVSLDQSYREELESIREGTIISYSGKLFRFEPPTRYFLIEGQVK
jgi:hypothetical protein